MKRGRLQFLGPDPRFTDPETAAVYLLPVPYQGGISYGSGTARAPQAVLKASAQVEFYDEELDAEPYLMGITALEPLSVRGGPEKLYERIRRRTAAILDAGRLPVLLGGDHSVSNGAIKACFDKYPSLAVIQFDAHADLRDSYLGSPLSHACPMARVRDYCSNTLQLGIRSLSGSEAERIKNESLAVFTMQQCRRAPEKVIAAVEALPDPVYITLDVDAFDGSVVRSTGTPEPGGFLWDEMLGFLTEIFQRRRVIGFDIVELSAHRHDSFSVFAAARLLYKMLGYRLRAHLARRNGDWPKAPAGPLFGIGPA